MIDTTTRTLVGLLPVVGGIRTAVYGLALNPGGTRAYVLRDIGGLTFFYGVVSVVDLLTNTVLATPVTGGVGGRSIAMDPSGTRAFVSSGLYFFPPLTMLVTAIDTTSDTIAYKVPVGEAGAIAVGPPGIVGPPASPPDLVIAKTHTSFMRGQTGAQYTITVSNGGGKPTSGLVMVVDTLPGGLTATAMSGAGWTCVLATLSCTRSDVLDPSASYPPITLTVDVAANAPTSVTNAANVSGGGDANPGNNSATDVTAIVPPDLTLSVAHAGDFTQGQVGARYSITVSNNGTGATVGTVTVMEEMDSVGPLTPTAMSVAGRTCVLATLTCTRSDVLDPGASYPPISLTVNVAADAPASVTNAANVSGGGEYDATNNRATDITPISVNAAPPAVPVPALDAWRLLLLALLLGIVALALARSQRP